MCKDEIVTMISDFSTKYLDDEYKSLNIKLVGKLSDKVSFETDKPELWAGGIVYAVGQLNFLFDREIKPFILRDEISYYFGCDLRKISLKSRDIRRLLELKLGDEEFSTEFVSSLNIPPSDGDLKRIRLLNEVKHQILPRRPLDADYVKNSEVEKLIRRIGDGEDCLEELYLLLRSVYFIQLHSENKSLMENTGDGGFRFLLFTSMDKSMEISDAYNGLEPELWAFYNIMDFIDGENFRGCYNQSRKR